MAIDRRVTRTRKALYDALGALMLEKPYAAIDVSEIVARADVGRSTFYAHFPSKDALLVRSLERVRPFLAEGSAAQRERPLTGSCRGTLALFRQVAAYRPLFEATEGTTARAMLEQAIEAELARFLSPFAASAAAAGLPRDLGLRFITGTFLSVMNWWLKSSRSPPADEVDRLFHQLIDRGIPSGFFGDRDRRVAA